MIGDPFLRAQARCTWTVFGSERILAVTCSVHNGCSFGCFARSFSWQCIQQLQFLEALRLGCGLDRVRPALDVSEAAGGAQWACWSESI